MSVRSKIFQPPITRKRIAIHACIMYFERTRGNKNVFSRFVFYLFFFLFFIPSWYFSSSRYPFTPTTCLICARACVGRFRSVGSSPDASVYDVYFILFYFLLLELCFLYLLNFFYNCTISSRCRATNIVQAWVGGGDEPNPVTGVAVVRGVRSVIFLVTSPPQAVLYSKRTL